MGNYHTCFHPRVSHMFVLRVKVQYTIILFITCILNGYIRQNTWHCTFVLRIEWKKWIPFDNASLAVAVARGIRPFQIDKLFIGLYIPSQKLRVGRLGLKKENKNMNIIIKGGDIIHNTYMQTSPTGTKVVTPIAFYRSPLHYHSSLITHPVHWAMHNC